MSDMNILTRGEEEKLVQSLKTNALKKCAPQIQEFVECSSGRMISVVWACRSKLKLMNSCLKNFTTEEERDKLKLKYIASRKNQ
ncbi:13370_t:CDS:2 [Ambispora gerdemannii]|uniref:COX assembly mitochondrial protein n=1 Tax=Ambispora gerdemannii TaxID=144530 RepID=A0A9N8VN09_9GLOM|nr:13370_t:CDS:2 [Ambispora gerdemannii]